MTIQDIKNYIYGNWRYMVYLFKPSLLTKYTRKKYERRLIDAEECLMNGSCLSCGCKTPELFMAYKGCKEGCYPPMKTIPERLKIILRWKTRKISLLRKVGIKL